jgi:hypothetical protein
MIEPKTHPIEQANASREEGSSQPAADDGPIVFRHPPQRAFPARNAHPKNNSESISPRSAQSKVTKPS